MGLEVISVLTEDVYVEALRQHVQPLDLFVTEKDFLQHVYATLGRAMSQTLYAILLMEHVK